MAERTAERAARIEHGFEAPMLVAALLTLPAVVIQYASTNEDAATVATVLNWVIWVAFAVEAVVMIAVSPDRVGWIKSHPLQCALVILTPPFGPPWLQSARALRLLRLVFAGAILHRLVSPEGLRRAAC